LELKQKIEKARCHGGGLVRPSGEAPRGSWVCGNASVSAHHTTISPRTRLVEALEVVETHLPVPDVVTLLLARERHLELVSLGLPRAEREAP